MTRERKEKKYYVLRQFDFHPKAPVLNQETGIMDWLVFINKVLLEHCHTHSLHIIHGFFHSRKAE
jgi:hypothetical protein